ncbi:iron complex outermembrane recepter protein [Pseudomonas citronellolis]|uniref:Metal-pseudopaline receptor CntO n=1 Tax=Pseudomonas citronellolis TaxID=53408 RepID=A0AAQ1KEV8_9PSED|nr:TonB-dependent siderophore receptor [Pseudomonas citronellolis]MDN6875884.1 TonB-dependent siderophore receptor [Pseudomonas citronellolis]SFC55361.1 iron complex outermembrane recepter protein [Pseudomonas citronellolis]
MATGPGQISPLHFPSHLLPRGLRLAGAIHALALGIGLASLPGQAQAADDERQEQDVLSLDSSTVLGAGESPVGPVPGVVAQRSLSGTKTDTPIREVPQALSVVTRKEMDEQKAQSVAEALRYTAGVQDSTGAASQRFDSIKIRGFDVSSTGMLRDGLRGTTTQAWPKVEPYGLERVEVLKGPASVLYGQNAPGGVVNQVSKRPLDQPFHEVEVVGGNHDRRQGQFDFSGPLDDEGKFLYRLTGLGRDSDTQTDHIVDRKTFVAPAFTWRPNEDTDLTVLAEYAEDEFGAPRVFVPLRGSLLSNPNGKIKHNQFLDEPGLDNHRTQYALGYLLDHRLNDVWSLHSSARYSHVNLLTNTASGMGLAADQRTLMRSAYRFRIIGDVYALDNNAQARWNIGDTEMTSLLGLDYRRTREDYYLRAGKAASIDIFNPVYGQGFGPIDRPMAQTQQRADQVGVYAQQQFTFDKHWVLSLGGRQDSSSARTDNRLADSGSKQRDEKFTYRAGLVYLADNGLAPYVSYSTSFNPSLGTDFYGNAYKPLTAKQSEVGVKYQPKGYDGFVTLAAYELTQENVLTTDPNNNLNQVQTGEVRVRGLELEGKASLARGLDLIGSATYNDAEVTRSNNPVEKGHRPTNTPRKMASLWLDYTQPDGPLAGLGFGAGVRYLGRTEADAANTITVPSYTLLDAAVHYELGQLFREAKGLRLSLNASNLTDKHYYNGCSASSCTIGEDRSLIASLSYRW